MAKQKKVNKNLVAFLTVMGILLSVTLVGVVTYQGSQKDPVKVAEQAKQAEDAGDVDRAIDFYLRAYEASRRKGTPDVAYYVSASKCAYGKGDIVMSLGLLTKANTQAPSDKGVLTALLERYWELQKMNQPVAKDANGYAEKMLRLDPKDVLALVTSANALWKSEDATQRTLADERMKQVVEIAPNDPRVVTTRAQRTLEVAAEIIRKTDRRVDGKLPPAEEAKVKELQNQALEITRVGVEKNPTSAELVADYAQMLVSMERVEDGIAALEGGVRAAAGDAEMHANLGRFLRAYVGFKIMKNDPLTPEKRSETLTRAAAESSKALELDPTLFEVYIDLAQTKLLDSDEKADAGADLARRFKAAIAVYEDGIKNTLNPKTMRAFVAPRGRLVILSMAFDAAHDFVLAAKDEESRKWAMDKAKKFAGDLKAQFPEDAMQHMKQGELALLERDERRAIQCFLAAEGASRTNIAVNRDANTQLARLYYAIGETGTARKYADTAAGQFGERQTPIELGLIQADMLLREKKLQEALDKCDQIAATDKAYADDTRLRRLRVAIYHEMGDETKAKQLAEAGGGDIEDILLRARLAIMQKDYATAEQSFVQALDGNPERGDVLRQYTQLMMKQEKRDEARTKLTDWRAKIKDTETQRVCDGLLIVLSSTNAEERQAKLLEAIEKIPDEASRYQELFVFYSNLEKDDKAAEALDKAEKLKPADRAILDAQFQLCLRRKQYDRAGQYTTRLAEVNADGCGGARYRGQLLLMRGDASGAIRELRNALAKLPDDSNILTMLALAQSNKPEESIATLRDALDSNPRSIVALKMLHEMLSKIGQREAAQDYLRRARDLAPDDPYVRKHAIVLDEEANPAAGIARREEIRKEKPQDVENLLRLSELYLKLPNFERSEEALQAAAALAPGSIQVVQRGISLYTTPDRLRVKSEREKCEKLFKAYIDAQTEADKVYGMMLLARYYMVLGEHDGAIKLLTELPARCDEFISDAKVRHDWQIEVTRELAEKYFELRMADPSNPDPKYIDLAVATMRKAIADCKPDDSAATRAQIRARLLEFMIRKQDLHAEMAKELDQFLKDFPNDYRGLTVKVQLQIAQAKFQDARDTLTTMLGLRPKDALALSTRGFVNTRLRLYDQAITDLTTAKALTQPDGDQPLSELGKLVRLRLANLYEQDEQHIEQAIGTHREIVDLSIAAQSKGFGGGQIDQAAAANLIRLYAMHRKPEDVDRLIADYEQKPGQPLNPFWPMQLGMLQLDRNAAAAAAAQFQRAYDLSGAGGRRKDSNAMTQLLVAKTKAGAAAEAIRIFEALPPESVTPPVRVAVAWAYEAQKDAAKANAALEAAVLDAAQKGLPLLKLTAQVIAENKQWPEIATLYGRVADGPGGASKEVAMRLRTVQAMAMIQSPRVKEVPALMKPIIDDVQPGSEEWMRASLIVAQAHMVSGDTPAAGAAYENVLKHMPNEVEALNNLAFFKAEAGELAEAEKYADRLAAMENTDANVVDTIGFVYSKKGRKAEAEAWFRDALRLEPTNVNARMHLAELLATSGKPEEARTLLERAATDADKQKDVESAKKARALLEKLGK